MDGTRSSYTLTETEAKSAPFCAQHARQLARRSTALAPELRLAHLRGPVGKPRVCCLTAVPARRGVPHHYRFHAPRSGCAGTRRAGRDLPTSEVSLLRRRPPSEPGPAGLVHDVRRLGVQQWGLRSGFECLERSNHLLGLICLERLSGRALAKNPVRAVEPHSCGAWNASGPTTPVRSEAVPRAQRRRRACHLK